LVVSLVYVLACRLFELVVLLARGERSKELEILVLRHELSILRRQVRRPQFAANDRPLAGPLRDLEQEDTRTRGRDLARPPCG
jgi:putative transposase